MACRSNPNLFEPSPADSPEPIPAPYPWMLPDAALTKRQRTVRAVLAQIDDIVSNIADRETRGAVVDVLAALRGPDVTPTGHDPKSRSTVYVRLAAFPRLTRGYEAPENAAYFEQALNVRWDVDPSPDGPRIPPTEYVSYHFMTHIDRAFEALGIVPRRDDNA